MNAIYFSLFLISNIYLFYQLSLIAPLGLKKHKDVQLENLFGKLKAYFLILGVLTLVELVAGVSSPLSFGDFLILIVLGVFGGVANLMFYYFRPLLEQRLGNEFSDKTKDRFLKVLSVWALVLRCATVLVVTLAQYDLIYNAV